METKLVNYKLPVELIEQIEELSKGNKTALVIDLLKQAIAMRNVDDQTRDYCYEGAKKSPSIDYSNKAMRNLIDGLHI
tara:strand:+ start:16953 stop:17186 length:234 start_codon:yes stop_codon:yes gene_type:complete